MINFWSKEYAESLVERFTYGALFCGIVAALGLVFWLSGCTV